MSLCTYLNTHMYCNNYYIVSGDANFDMKQTGLTLGGFIQPSVARNLLEQPANTEKGLCQRFLWFVPKPTPVPFDELEKVNAEFTADIGMYVLQHLNYILNCIPHTCAMASTGIVIFFYSQS